MMMPARIASTCEIRRVFVIAGSFSLAALALVFEAFPYLDLAASGAVKASCAGESRFGGWCHGNGILWFPRAVGMALPVLVVAGAVLWAVSAWRSQSQRNRALFLIACFVSGPGLVANVILKDHWGRARPREVVELGGQKAFTPPLVPSSACDSNCSFVSGEASAVFAILFAAALVFPRRWRTLLAIGLAGGMLTGLIRISMGGHFLSDVLFAGALMALVTAGIHAAMFGFGQTWPGLFSIGSRPAFADPALSQSTALEARS